jgi:hypothetical protein
MKTVMRAALLSGIVLFLSIQVSARAAEDAPKPDYAGQAREVMRHIQQTFCDPKTGLYLKSAKDRTPDYVWRQAAMFSVLVGATRHEPQAYRPILDKFFHALDVYWDTKAPIPGYEPAPTRGNGHDKYYDDNAWLVITFAEGFQLTGEKAYLTRAEETARFVASGWDEQAGGGIWWHQSHKDGSKNTCANGPAAVGYLYLARLGPAAEAQSWITAAAKVVDWTCQKLQAPDDLFDDRLIVATGEVKRGKLTYNSALMLRACVDLFRQTGETRYLGQAKRIAKAADWFTDKQTGVYRDPLKWSHFMVEADLDLYRATGEEYLMRRATTNVDAYYAQWKKQPPQDMMSNADVARLLWLMADTQSEVGRAFWKAADQKRTVSGASEK